MLHWRGLGVRARGTLRGVGVRRGGWEGGGACTTWGWGGLRYFEVGGGGGGGLVVHWRGLGGRARGTLRGVGVRGGGSEA